MPTRKLGRREAAVVRSARAAGLPATDEAAILAARDLARMLDIYPDNFDVVKLASPRLMVILNGLGLSPTGRSVVKGRKAAGEVIHDDDSAPDDELAEARAKRGPGARRNAAAHRNSTAR